MKVFHPVMYEVGRLWQTGQITVAHEHFCSAATQLIMSELYPRIRQTSGQKDKTVVAACVAGELHEIGLRMIADLLELDGWRTIYIGANTPAVGIIDIAREQKAQVLAVSMSLPVNGPALRELIAAARQELGEGIKIIIGGYILATNPKYAVSFQADGVVKKAEEAAEVLNELIEKAAINAGQ
jgi:methanogenic corrinoid protein MtbC1